MDAQYCAAEFDPDGERVCVYHPETNRVHETTTGSVHHFDLLSQGYKLIQPLTKQRIQDASWHVQFHYHGHAMCSRTVGPRGGVTVKIVLVRQNGAMQTWKREPSRFRQPCKYGLKEYVQIMQDNAHEFHHPDDCPIKAACGF